jgi:hypothetical protein
MTPFNPGTQRVTESQIGIHRDGQEKHCALKRLLPERGHSKKNQGTAEHAQQQSAQDGADDSSDAARDGNAPHHRRGNNS